MTITSAPGAPGQPDPRRRGRLHAVRVAANELATATTPNAAALLKDVRIDEHSCPQLRGWLEAVGCKLTSEELRSPHSHGMVWRVSGIRRGDGVLYVLCIPSVILDEPTEDALGAMGYFERLLPEKSHVLVLSPDLDAPHDAYEAMFENWGGGVTARFIPWRRVRDLEDDHADAEHEIGRILRLDEHLPEPLPQNVVALMPAGGGGGGPRNLTKQDEEFIAGILATLATNDLKDPHDYLSGVVDRLMVEGSHGLSARVGDPDYVARRVVSWAAMRGRYPEEHECAGCKVIGVLIHVMAASFFNEDRDKLVRIVDECSLLNTQWRDTLGSSGN